MSEPIRIAIRADAGRMLGTGHLARTSAVASVLTACGSVEVLLVANREAAALVPSYFPTGIDLVELDDAAKDPHSILRQLGTEDRLPDVVYLDHYGEVPQWEAAAREAGVGLLVIDDLDAASAADVIVRPHGGEESAGGSIMLRGPAYLPLSRYVADAAAKHTTVPKPDTPRLNVCFGGTDPTGETAKAITALRQTDRVTADIIVGPGSTIDPAAIASAEQMDHLTVHRAPSQADLARIMSEADLALGAGGVMLWERLCLGLPSLVIAAANNQRPQVEAMAAAGAIRFLGYHDDVSVDAITAAIESLAADTTGRMEMCQVGQALVDGRGAYRIAAWLRALPLEARDVTASDGPKLLAWRTADENWRHNWDDSAPPSLAEHLAWLAKRLADDHCVFRIISWQGEPVGVVRFDMSATCDEAYLSIYLVPGWHGQRMGLPVFFAAERALRRSHPSVTRIVSRIEQDNESSVRLHRDAGFQFAPSGERADWYRAWKDLH